MKENENNSGIESDSSDDQIKAHAAIGRTQDKPNIDSTSRAYLKNVLMKYLEYQANGQEKESMTMEKVLFTVLKVQEQDVSTLQEARLKSYNSGIMSYFWALELEKVVAKPV